MRTFVWPPTRGAPRILRVGLLIAAAVVVASLAALALVLIPRGEEAPGSGAEGGSGQAGGAESSSRQGGRTIYVAGSGSASTGGTKSEPFREIREAIAVARRGDTILVADGTYDGFDVRRFGGPLTIRATGRDARIVPTSDRSDDRDTMLITESSRIVLDGLRSFGAARAAVRVDRSSAVTVRNGVFGENQTWGIFTNHSDDLIIEDNEAYGSVDEHGIYVSNSGDRPIVRRNVVRGNVASGIQLNADASEGGDGIISGALIEANVVEGNGVEGGAAINLDGVQDSVVRNNLLTGNHATGIAAYRIDGAAGPRNLRILHNTIDMAPDSRWCILVWDTSGKVFVQNNILLSRNPERGGISHLDDGDVAQTDSDYNVFAGASFVTPDDATTRIPLSSWKAAGHEGHSVSASAAGLFAADHRLSPGSPAVDRGQTLADARRDLAGTRRPVGPASDIGAFERR